MINSYIQDNKENNEVTKQVNEIIEDWAEWDLTAVGLGILKYSSEEHLLFSYAYRNTINSDVYLESCYLRNKIWDISDSNPNEGPIISRVNEYTFRALEYKGFFDIYLFNVSLPLHTIKVNGIYIIYENGLIFLCENMNFEADLFIFNDLAGWNVVDYDLFDNMIWESRYVNDVI